MSENPLVVECVKLLVSCKQAYVASFPDSMRGANPHSLNQITKQEREG